MLNLKKIKDFLFERVNNYGAYYVIFGIFGIVNYPASYIFWRLTEASGYENLTLRLIASALCIPLAFEKFLPSSFRKNLPLWWLLTLTYSLSFFGTYMLLENNFSASWLMNDVLGLFLLVLIVDWIIFLLLLAVGISLGCLVFFLIHSTDALTVNAGNLRVALYMYFFAILIGTLFSRNKQKIEEAKTAAAYAVSANIAHELRTPLVSINAAVSSSQRYFSVLMQGYSLAQANNLAVEKIPVNKMKLLPDILNNIQEEVRYSNLFIDMLLLNIQNLQVKAEDLKVVSISELIHHAFKRYPFDEAQEELIHFDERNDFKVRVVLLFFEHIVFNLIKNALYYIKDAGKGEITIWYELDKNYNYLHFKDTGKGMSKKTLSHLFERFYTNRHQGTGVGLAFCKQMMEQFEGDIDCESVEGEYTHFILKFPIVKD